MPEQAILLLADISGYTEFMRLHRLNLAHSQEITQRLLESMLDAVPSLRLVEVEGDALFLAAPHSEPANADGWLPSALAMYRAFHSEQQWMLAHNLCVCDACRQIGRLRVKFVAHLGEVITQRIRDTEKLVGVDVIAVHRMLKNTVPAAEYVLMSEPLYAHLDPELRDQAVPIEQELEGIGSMPLYFVEFDALPVELPPVPKPTLPARVRQTVGLGLRAFPRLLGRQPERSASPIRMPSGPRT
jgi:class 3 adenylate cyclase